VRRGVRGQGAADCGVFPRRGPQSRSGWDPICNWTAHDFEAGGASVRATGRMSAIEGTKAGGMNLKGAVRRPVPVVAFPRNPAAPMRGSPVFNRSCIARGIARRCGEAVSAPKGRDGNRQAESGQGRAQGRSWVRFPSTEWAHRLIGNSVPAECYGVGDVSIYPINPMVHKSPHETPTNRFVYPWPGANLRGNSKRKANQLPPKARGQGLLAGSSGKEGNWAT